MRLIRKLSALGVAVFLIAAVAASAASATTIHSGSATGPLYSGSVSGTTLGNQVFKSPYLGTVTCTSSSLSGTTDSSGVGSISAASWSGCTSSLGMSCTVATSGFNWSSNASYAPVSGGRDGTMTTTVPTGGTAVTCAGLVKCSYHGTVTGDSYSPDSTAKPASSSHAEVKYSGVTLTGEVSTCGNGTWTGTYALTGSGGADLWTEA